MTRLYLDLGPSFAANISTQRNPLADAITTTLDRQVQQNLKRTGMAPAVTLVSSLVTMGGAHAAVFEVDNLNDSGPGSLRQAILDANNNPGLDAITFADGVTGTLSMYNGEFDIYDSVVIQGPGEANLTIDANNNSRIFDFQPNQNETTLEIRDLTLYDGNSGIGNRGYFGPGNYRGGAIRVNGYTYETRGGPAVYSRLRLDSVTITESYAYGDGGAVFAEDSFVEIINSTISNNSSDENGGGIHIQEGALTITGSTFDQNDANEGGGGSISVDDAFSVFIDNTYVTDSYASSDGGGIYLGNIEVNATIANSTITGNGSDSQGGGIDAFNFTDGAVLEINNTTIRYNYASGYGGGIYIDSSDLHVLNNSVVSNNYTDGSGGGIRFASENISHELRIEDSTIDGNSAGEYGGGVHFYTDQATLLVRNSSVSGNTGNYGGGVAITYDDGAGTHIGQITLDNATIDNNNANVGGGVFWELDETYAPTLITDSSISGNTAESGRGGGLFLYFDDGMYSRMTIRNTVIDGNSASDDGGGIWFYDDDGYDVVIENSTISNNTSDNDGGGLWFYSDDGAPFIRNSTISGNSAGRNGGGLLLTQEDGDARIDNSTVVNNYAYYTGGGLFNGYIDSGTVYGSELRIRSSIIANNSVNNGNYSAIAGVDVYAQFSLIENLDGFNLTGNNNNIFYTDPMLGPLADNGGPTMTHALLAGSPAIDAGLNVAPSADDQRGNGFARIVGLQTDMGAVESTTDDPVNFPPYTQLVTNLNNAGPGSLRQAVIDANGNYGLDVIEFQAGLSGTITLTSGDIDIYDSLVINAPVPSVITVSGGFSGGPEPNRGVGYSRIFDMRGGFGERGGPADPSNNLTSVDIVGLTISDGYDSNGGGISAYNVELTIRDSIVTNNTSYADYGGGGGIDHNAGVLRIIDSTISGNTAQNEGSDGGGIRINNASLVIRDSYLNNNDAYDNGGGIHADRVYSVAIAGTTMDGNQARDSGGAIDLASYSYRPTPTGPNGRGDIGSMLIANSTISGNSASRYGGGINIYDGGRYGDALTLNNASISGNTADYGGGIHIHEDGRSLFVLNNSSIMNNTAYYDGGGIRFLAENDGDALIVDNSTISGNTADESDGGGIFFYSDTATLDITNSTLNNNFAQSDGGAIAIYLDNDSYQSFSIIDTTISGNTAGESGGGVYLRIYDGAALQGPVLIENTNFTSNVSSGDGGGLFIEAYEGLYGGVTIRNSTIANNSAQEEGSGGGVFISDDESNYAFVFDNTTVSGNYASDDGGGLSIYTEDANLFIRNSTFSNNSASQYGGGIAIDYLDSTAFIANSTITGNSATYGGGIYSNDTTLQVLGSIISGNTSGESSDDVYLNGGEANFLFSILGDLEPNVYDRAFNEFYADPLLAPLADNGGPTQTHALMAGSPAINRGFNFVASTTDQRLTGFPRTIGGSTDMGAFEAIGNPVFTLDVTGSPFAEAGGMATIDANATEAVGTTTFIDLSFGGVAILDTDFMVDDNTLIIPFGTDMSAAPATMTGIDDPLFEGDEGIDITGITNTLGPALMANAVITDDDTPPMVTLSLAGSPINEGGSATVTATLSAISGLDTTVNLLTSGTATPTTDFGLPASIVVPAGMMSADTTLTTVDDNLGEVDETVIVDIDSVVNGTEDGVQQVTATIIDDDAPAVSLSLVGDPIAENGGISTITATLSNPSDLAVTTNLTFSGTATEGVDFISVNNVVVPPGMLSADFTLTAIDDALDEGDEIAVIDIASVVNGTENGVQQVMTTITDDDGTLVSVSLSVTEVDEGGNADIILTLDEIANGDVTIELGFSGSAMMPEDYTVSGTMVTIPAGETTGTIGLMVNLDLVADPNETVVIDIVDVLGGTEDGEQQEILIIRDTPVEVPTLNDFGKWLMALLLPLAGFLGLRRRRQPK